MTAYRPTRRSKCVVCTARRLPEGHMCKDCQSSFAQTFPGLVYDTERVAWVQIVAWAAKRARASVRTKER